MSSRRAQLIACLEKGLHYFSIGQFAEARAFWEKALELDPNNAQAHEFMQYVSDETKGPAATSQPASQQEPPEDRRTGGRISRAGLLAETPPHTAIPGVTSAHDQGNSPVRDLSTRRLERYDEPPIQVQAEPLHPPRAAAPVSKLDFMAPSTHNIEDLLVPPSQSELDQVPHSQYPESPHLLGGSGLMPPSLGAFAPLEAGAVGLLDQRGAHPLFGDEPSAPMATRPTQPQPAAPEPAIPAPIPEPPEHPPASSVHAQRDLSTRLMPVLPKQPTQPIQESPQGHEEAPKLNSGRTTLPPVSSAKIIQNIEALAPSESFSSPSIDTSTAPSYESNEAPPAHTVPSNETDPSLHNSGEHHSIEIEPHEQAAPPKLSPDQIAELIDVSDAGETNDIEATAAATENGEAFTVPPSSPGLLYSDSDGIGRAPVTPPPIQGPPPPPENASTPEIAEIPKSLEAPEVSASAEHWNEQEIPSSPMDGFEDTPSDEFPAAENDALNGNSQSTLASASFNSASFNSASASFSEFPFEDEQEESKVADVADTPLFESETMIELGGAEAAGHLGPEYGDPMESPTPSSEMPRSTEESYPHEGSQLEFTGLPEIPERPFQEAGQVISLDLQGTDEPYIQEEQHSPILTYRSNSGDAEPYPHPQEGQHTAHDTSSFQGDIDPFASQDPFDQPYDDPFANEGGNTARHTNRFIDQDDHQDPYAQTSAHPYNPNDPYNNTTTTPASSSSVPASNYNSNYNNTPNYDDAYTPTPDPYAQTPDPYAQTPDPYTQAPDPHRQTPDPYTQAPDPYAQTPDPYAQTPDPYAQTPDPYAQTSAAYGQTPDPYGQTSAAYGQTSDPYGQTSAAYGQTPDPYGQTPDPYGQTPDPYGQTPDPYGQTPDPYGQTPDPVHNPTPQYEGHTDAYDPYDQALDPSYEAAANSYDPHAQTVSPNMAAGVNDPLAHDVDTPISGVSAFEQPDASDGVLDLDHVFDEDDDMFDGEPTPDAPMPSIHEQIAHLPSAALRHEYVEHESKAAPPPPPAEELGEVDILLTGAKDLLREEDYRSAIELLEMAKNQSPDHAEVLELYETCKAEVEKIYLSEITSLDLIPHVKCTMDEIMRLNIDHRVGFLISQIDGHTSLSDLIILTGFNENELVRVIGQLNDQGVIHLD